MISVASLGVSIFGRSNQIIHERSTGPGRRSCRNAGQHHLGIQVHHFVAGMGAAPLEKKFSHPGRCPLLAAAKRWLVIEDTPMPKTGETDLMIKNTMPASSYQGD